MRGRVAGHARVPPLADDGEARSGPEDAVREVPAPRELGRPKGPAKAKPIDVLPEERPAPVAMALKRPPEDARRPAGPRPALALQARMPIEKLSGPALPAEPTKKPQERRAVTKIMLLPWVPAPETVAPTKPRVAPRPGRRAGPAARGPLIARGQARRRRAGGRGPRGRRAPA